LFCRGGPVKSAPSISLQDTGDRSSAGQCRVLGHIRSLEKRVLTLSVKLVFMFVFALALQAACSWLLLLVMTGPASRCPALGRSLSQSASCFCGACDAVSTGIQATVSDLSALAPIRNYKADSPRVGLLLVATPGWPLLHGGRAPTAGVAALVCQSVSGAHARTLLSDPEQTYMPLLHWCPYRSIPCELHHPGM
jgi:hypothetical protein